MAYLAITLAFVIAVLELFKPDNASRPFRIMVGCVLLAFSCVQFSMTSEDSYQEATQRQAGVLKPEISLAGFFVELEQAKVQLGESETFFAWSGTPGEPLFSVGTGNRIAVRVEDGNLLVSATIRDRSGDLVAGIADNEWNVNPHRTFDRNFSKSALEVKSAEGIIVLQVRLVDDAVQLRAKLTTDDGRSVLIGGEKGGNGYFDIRPPKFVHLQPEIKPLFKYPSDLHLGEYQ